MSSVDPDFWMSLPFRQAGCWLAAEALWPDGLPPDIPPSVRDQKIREWMVWRGRPWVSTQTIWRALKNYPRLPAVRVPRRAA